MDQKLLNVTALAIVACGGRTISNGAVAGGGEAIDASTDSSAAQAIEASAPTMQDAQEAIDTSTDSLPLQSVDAPAPTVDDASTLDTATPAMEPALDASPIPLDAFGERLTFNTASCGMPDAEAGQPPTACPCMGAAPACSLPDAGTAECTSTDLQGQTCETLGFTGGTLACSASCSFDTSNCDTCVVGPHTACGSLHVGDALASTWWYDGYRYVTDVAFALAASDTEIGVAWADGNGTLHFTRLRSDLTPLSHECLATGSFEASRDTPPSRALSLASTSTGWLIAAYHYTGVCPGEVPKGTFLYPLDRAGRGRGPPELVCGTPPPNFSEVDLAGGPTLSSLPGGGRLLLSWLEWNYYWGIGGNPPRLQLQVLESDGRPVADPDGGSPTVYRLGLPASSYTSVAIDDGFAAETPNGSNMLTHIAFDGTLRSSSLALSTDNANNRLAWSGSELRLLYQAVGGFLQRVGAAGGRIGNPTPINAGPGYALDYDTLLAIGPDSVVHVTESSSSNYVENLVRLDSNGVPVVPPVPVVRANYAVTLQAVAQGGDAVVAWTAPSNLRPTRIELARVRLAP